MSSTFDTPTKPRRGNGITTPSRRGGSGRILTDVIVDLGFVDRGTMDLAIDRATRERLRARAHPRRRRHALRRPPLARDRRALRPRPRRPQALPRRSRRRQARRPRRRPPLPGRAGLLRRRPHAAGGDGRPRQRPRDRRHRGHDGLRGPPGGLLAAGRRVAAGAPRGPGLRPRRGRARGARGRPRGRPAPARPSAPAAPALRHPRERADQLRRRRRGRVGHPARAPGDQGGRRARRLRHPLRAPGRRDAGPLPHRRRAPGGRDRPGQRRPGGHLAHQDPLRPRHRRAPHPAGRPHLARGRRQADRPPRRHASRLATARRSSCASSTRARS